MQVMKPFNTLIDTASLLDSEMKFAEIPLKHLEKKSSIYEAQLNSYRTINELINTLSSASLNLNAACLAKQYTVNSSNTAIITPMSSATNVALGEYTLQVQQLAQSQIITGTGFASNTSSLDLASSLEISVNGVTSSITINSSDSLDTIKESINSAPDNPGVTASIIAVNDNSGNPEYRLILSANHSGLSNQITLSGNTTAVDFLGLTNTTHQAQDALFTVNGYPVQRSSNTVDDVLSGVVFTLNAVSDVDIRLSINENKQSNYEAITNAVNDFVTAYNAVIKELNQDKMTSYLKESTYGYIKNDFNALINQSFVTGTIQRLYDLGMSASSGTTLFNDQHVEYLSTGAIELDSSKLKQVLINDYASVVNFFTKTNTGFLAKTEEMITTLNDSNGVINKREQAISQLDTKNKTMIDEKKDKLDELRGKLTKKYAELDSKISQLQSISDYIKMQFEPRETNH